MFNTELYRRGRIQKFPLTVCKAVPHEWHCVLPTGNWAKLGFLLKSWAWAKWILSKEGLRASVGSSESIGPMGARTASRRKPSQPLPAHWEKCDNILINHIAEILLPGGILLSFCFKNKISHRCICGLWPDLLGGWVWKASWPKRHHKTSYLLMLTKDSILPHFYSSGCSRLTLPLELPQPRICHPQFIP